MRILHLATFLQGGAGLAVAELAVGQRERGHDVSAMTSLTAVDGYGNYPPYLNRLARAGVNLLLIDSLFVRDSGSNAAVLALLRTEVSLNGTFDIVHAHAAVPSRIGLAMAAEHRHPPVLQTMHGWGLAKSPDQARADIEVLNRIARVIVPSRSSADLLQQLGVAPSLIRVIPYGVRAATDVEADIGHDRDFQFLKGERAARRRIICCIGSVGHRKNQQLLVQAMALLPPDVRPLCVFIGEGEVEDLRTLTSRLHLDQWIRILGYKPAPRPFLSLADWMVLPSRSEGMPLAVLEAFAERVPVIASNIPDLSELVQSHRNGLLFDEGSAPALASALLTALTVPEDARRALSESAEQDYLARHGTDRMVDAYEAEYRSLIELQSPRSGSPCAA